RSEGSSGLGAAQIPVDSSGRVSRSRVIMRLPPNQFENMGEPHGSCQSLAGDVPDGENKLVPKFQRADEIAGQVLHREYLGCDFKPVSANLPGPAQPTLHLRGLEHGAAESVMFIPQAFELFLQSADALRGFRSGNSFMARSLRHSSARESRL